MGDTVEFDPQGQQPTFVGKGSKIEHPDLLPLFWGPYWPGSDPMTSIEILQAVHALADGPYLDGLKQYGYVGPVSVRDPMYVSYQPNVSNGQPTSVTRAVYNMIQDLLNKDEIANVDDNHDLIVAVFLDPSIPQVSTISGSNTALDNPEFLDDATRFEVLWVLTASLNFGSVMRIFSHELVESITDPYGTGWEQTSPPPPPNQGQIGDVCNQPGIVDGVGVVAYWSSADRACIIPTSGARRLTLAPPTINQTDNPRVPKQAFVDLGTLCARDFFDYVEATYEHSIQLHADIVGYESPSITWTINGEPVPLLDGTLEVPATWDDLPVSRFSRVVIRRPTATLQTLKLSPESTDIRIDIGPGQGNVNLEIVCSAVESFDSISNGGRGLTNHHAVLSLPVTNQKLEWGQRYQDAVKNCQHVRHLAAGPTPSIGPSTPGDPFNIAQALRRLLADSGSQQSERLLRAAALIKNHSQEVAEALESQAEELK
jgi:hypothetical protein